MPFRMPILERAPLAGGDSEGQTGKASALFDSTGPSAAFSFVANMKADWMPAFDDFFKITNGPAYVGADAADRERDLQLVTKLAHAYLAKVRLNAD